MIELISELPDNVLGLRVGGTLSAEDYDAIITPAVESRLARFVKLRLLCLVQNDFTGLSAGAVWRDARLGTKHFTDFERVAVVTDKDWLDSLMRVFGFIVPGETATFRLADYEQAKAWILEPPSPGHLEFRLQRDTGILVLKPHGELQAADFARVAAEVDPYLAAQGHLAGVIVVAETFPGWDNFAAMASHFRFVREHVRKVRRVALVTSSRFLAALPHLAALFVSAEVRHFPMTEQASALAWVSGEPGGSPASI
jgi:hypothetical protein